MKFQFYFLLFIGFLLGNSSLSAQDTLAISQWKSHFPYERAISVTQSAEKIYYASKNALLIVNKDDLSLERFSKVEGLSETELSIIKYNNLSDMLIVGYKSGVIDIFKDGEKKVIYDIANFNAIPGKKTINDIFIKNDSIVYLSMNVGVSELNLNSGLFLFTTFTQSNVAAAVFFNNYLYISTDEGIFRIDETTAINVIDFSTWEFMGADFGLPDAYYSNAIAIFNNQLYFDVNDTLFAYDNGHLTNVFQKDNHSIRYLSTEGNGLLIGTKRHDLETGSVYYLNQDINIAPISSELIYSPYYGIEDKTGNLWFADQKEEFFWRRKSDGAFLKFAIERPVTGVFDIKLFGDELWCVSGHYTEAYYQNGFASYINGHWKQYSQLQYPEITTNRFYTLTSIIKHPTTGNFYLSSFLSGVAKFDGEQLNFYNETNSTLQTHPGSTSSTRVADLAFDENNNLWISNNGSLRPIVVLKNDGNWTSFPIPYDSRELLDLIIDSYGYKWFIINETDAGILLFDDNNTLDNTEDDRYRQLTQTNSNLPSNAVSCVVEDLDGDIWVGTSEGIVSFECGSSIFENDCKASKQLVSEGGHNEYLFSDQKILTIAVDGANRKWVGTGAGIFVLSPDGLELIAHYDTKNSPLANNSVFRIIFHPKTGITYVLTNAGIQSFRTDATTGGIVNSSEITVFPNPVRPEYSGIIAINGLAQDADIKITDISGQLVYATKANGGQALWDGRDYNGKKASSGVYLVFSTAVKNQLNTDAVVAKILFMN